MLAQLIEVLLGEVAPLLVSDNDPNEVEVVVIRALLKVAGASLTAGRRVEDGTLAPDAAAALARMPGLTGGGSAAVAAAGTLFECISRLFCDKGFRTLLREQAGKTGRLANVNKLISAASDMSAAAAQQKVALSRSVGASGDGPSGSQPRAIVRKGGALAGAPAARRPGPASPRLAAAAIVTEPGRLRGKTATLPRASDLPKGIAAQLDGIFAYKARGRSVTTTVGDFIAALADSADFAVTRAAIPAFSTSGRGLLLCLLQRLAEEGQLTVDPRLSADLAMATVRVYTNNNAAATAYRLARALRDGPDHEKLPDGEQRRLANLLARAALRSGRLDEAAKLYRDTFLARPDSADAMVNYFTSIFVTDPESAVSIGKAILANNIQVAQNDLVFVGDVLLSRDCVDEAETAFLRVLRDEPSYADGFLGLANVAAVRGRPEMWWAAMARFGALSGLRIDPQEEASAVGHPFAFSAGAEPRRDGPLVTVVTTCFNSAGTLAASVESVLAQSAGNLELYIVDDVSEDGSRDLIRSLAERDDRVKYIFNERNMGTYASKNQAIARAAGAFVTFHDSDDWMHPDRIAAQLEAMTGGTACSTSQWIRMDASGRAIVRRGGPYLHLNPASTFIRREVFEAIGPFDAVRTGADSEILSRIRNHYGVDSVTNLSTCLGVGSHVETSLTQSGATAFDEYRYSPIRLAYTEAWLEWHLQRMLKGLPIALKGEGRRPFAIPDAIRP